MQDKFKIRPTTEKEFFYFISLPEVIEAIEPYNKDVIPKYNNDCYTLEYKDYQCIVQIKDIGPRVVEAHPLIPLESRPAARVLCLGILQWLEAIGTKAALTTCYTKNILNFAKKLGFKLTNTVGDKYFLVYNFTN